MLNQFYVVLGLRPNLSKCEIAGIGSLKDAKLVLWTEKFSFNQREH